MREDKEERSTGGIKEERGQAPVPAWMGVVNADGAAQEPQSAPDGVLSPPALVV